MICNVSDGRADTCGGVIYPVFGGLKEGISLESCLYIFFSDPGNFVGGKTENDSPTKGCQ
jgi:hypothetical protein